MFFNKDKEFKLLLQKSKQAYKDLEEQYLKLRKEHWDLLKMFDEIEKQDDKIEELKDTIENLSKELAYKTELLGEYHLKFGEECYQHIVEKRSRIKKRTSKNDSENDEGVEL